MAALIPPAAATECERTGWTLLMIATLAPSSAAASAARWPARPAPMIKTSCAGMAPWGRFEGTGKGCCEDWGLRPGLYNERQAERLDGRASPLARRLPDEAQVAGRAGAAGRS